MKHALVKDGAIIEFRNYAPNADQSELAEGKPRMLPVEIAAAEFDPVSQVVEGPVYEVEETRVVERYTARAKNSDEVAEMKSAKHEETEAEFARLYCEPIAFTVDGVEYQFHADAEARENISGIVLLIAIGAPIPNPRPWTPLGSMTPVDITHAELAGLGGAIAARKDALFTIKKAKQAALAELTEPVDVDAVDPLAGWELA